MGGWEWTYWAIRLCSSSSMMLISRISAPGMPCAYKSNFICFTANISPVLRSLARYTRPKEPVHIDNVCCVGADRLIGSVGFGDNAPSGKITCHRCIWTKWVGGAWAVLESGSRQRTNGRTFTQGTTCVHYVVFHSEIQAGLLSNFNGIILLIERR